MLDNLNCFVEEKRDFLSTSIHILESVCVAGHTIHMEKSKGTPPVLRV